MMKTFYTILILIAAFATQTFAQTSARVVGPNEKKVTEAICKTLSERDLSKVSTKEQAVALYTECIMAHIDLLQDLAEERKVNMEDQAAMQKVGADIAVDLIKGKCEVFIKLSTMMAGVSAANNDNVSSLTTGTLKRIDNKGFNYLVINDNGTEKSFLWLRQFPGSEVFNNGLGTNINKKIGVNWQEIEVYLPDAKGYYKVKEITGITMQ